MKKVIKNNWLDNLNYQYDGNLNYLEYQNNDPDDPKKSKYTAKTVPKNISRNELRPHMFINDDEYIKFFKTNTYNCGKDGCAEFANQYAGKAIGLTGKDFSDWVKMKAKAGVGGHAWQNYGNIINAGGNIYSPEKLKKDEITGNAVPIKSAIAYGSAFGNPAVERMVKPINNPYIFKGDEPYTTPDMKGEYGTHYMFSQDNYAIPMIQQGLNGLFFNENASPSDKEAIRFRTDREAENFAKRYKEFAPAFKYKYKKGGWLDNL